MKRKQENYVKMVGIIAGSTLLPNGGGLIFSPVVPMVVGCWLPVAYFVDSVVTIAGWLS